MTFTGGEQPAPGDNDNDNDNDEEVPMSSTYTVSDRNALFSGLTAAAARDLAARWYADSDWDSDLGRLQAAGVDLSVEYTDADSPEDVAQRVSDHVASALADLDVEDGRTEPWCDLLRDHYAACRVRVTADE